MCGTCPREMERTGSGLPVPEQWARLSGLHTCPGAATSPGDCGKDGRRVWDDPTLVDGYPISASHQMQNDALPPLPGKAAAMLWAGTVCPSDRGSSSLSPREPRQPRVRWASCTARRGGVFKGLSRRQTVPVLQFILHICCL